MHYDVILGKDIREERESVINYCSCQILINEVVVNSDPRPCAIRTEPRILTFKTSTENTVKFPTTSKVLGLVTMSELLSSISHFIVNKGGKRWLNHYHYTHKRDR